MKEQILLFHFDDSERLNAVRKAMLPLHVACKVIGEDAWDLQIGAIVGLEVTAQDAPAAEEITQEMLMLCGLSDNSMQQVLFALRKAGLVIPYKAMLTPYNKDWTAKQLFGELRQEHEEMKAMQQKK